MKKFPYSGIFHPFGLTKASNAPHYRSTDGMIENVIGVSIRYNIFSNIWNI